MSRQSSDRFEQIVHHAARGWSYLFPNPRFYGWAVVATCFFCAMLSSPGQSFAISLYIDHLIADLGLTRMGLSSLYGAMTLTAAVCLPLVGRVADRVAGRHFLPAVLVAIGVACLYFSRVNSWIGVAIAFVFLRLFGQGAVGLGNLTVVVRWFREYRGRALAVVNLGYAGGEMLFPSLILAVIAAVGWRGSLLAFGGAYLLVFAPLVWWLVRPRGTDEYVDGADQPESAVDDEQGDSEDGGAEGPEFEFGTVLTMPGFWIMAICVSVLPLVATAVIFHQVALFGSLGWAKSLIAPAFVGYAAARIATTYLTGLALETYPSRFGISGGMVLAAMALSATALPVPPVVGSLIYGAGLGGAGGVLAASNEVVWPEYYGIAAVGSIKGAVTAIRNGSTAAGPPLVAYLIGADEQFGVAIAVLAVMCIAAAVAAPLVKPPRGGKHS